MIQSILVQIFGPQLYVLAAAGLFVLSMAIIIITGIAVMAKLSGAYEE